MAPPPELVSRRELDIKGLTSTRCRALAREDTGLWNGIPITSPARTLIDVAPHLSAEALARACHEAGVKYGTTPREVEEALSRKPNAHGAARLRAIIAGDEKVTLSRFHNSRHSWEADYQREREARDRGDEFRRFTWADVFETPAHMMRQLHALLGTRAAA